MTVAINKDVLFSKTNISINQTRCQFQRKSKKSLAVIPVIIYQYNMEIYDTNKDESLIKIQEDENQNESNYNTLENLNESKQEILIENNSQPSQSTHHKSKNHLKDKILIPTKDKKTFNQKSLKFINRNDIVFMSTKEIKPEIKLTHQKKSNFTSRNQNCKNVIENKYKKEFGSEKSLKSNRINFSLKNVLTDSSQDQNSKIGSIIYEKARRATFYQKSQNFLNQNFDKMHLFNKYFPNGNFTIIIQNIKRIERSKIKIERIKNRISIKKLKMMKALSLKKNKKSNLFG